MAKKHAGSGASSSALGFRRVPVRVEGLVYRQRGSLCMGCVLWCVEALQGGHSRLVGTGSNCSAGVLYDVEALVHSFEEEVRRGVFYVDVIALSVSSAKA